MTEPSKQADLLPCPFCGGEAEWCSHSGEALWIACSECGAIGPQNEDTTAANRATTLAAWNTRPKQADAVREAWQPIETFNEPTALSSGCGVLVAEADGTVGEAYFRNFGDESDGWWWANTSWGDYPEPGRPAPIQWMPLPSAQLKEPTHD